MEYLTLSSKRCCAERDSPDWVVRRLSSMFSCPAAGSGVAEALDDAKLEDAKHVDLAQRGASNAADAASATRGTL